MLNLKFNYARIIIYARSDLNMLISIKFCDIGINEQLENFNFHSPYPLLAPEKHTSIRVHDIF